jgi:RNA polymerase sigma-70 factor (ECF subfamily)
MPAKDSEPRIASLLAAIAESRASGGSARSEAAVREQLFEIAYARMQSLAQRMIRGYPQVRRWDETADVVQAAALRLHRALAAVELRDPRHLLRLTALQIRRELLDLARKHASPESAAAHHETNVLASADGVLMKVDLATDAAAEPVDRLEPWTRLHDAVAALEADDREVFDLVWFMGATQHDIAALTGSSPRTVRRQWESIKRRLVAALDGELPGG